ncbi:MAG: protein kinase [Cyanobacteria bacterium HKST-UBA02]|nr:protein kinase [Cyanobacteria bacterium HKST-UBA02]
MPSQPETIGKYRVLGRLGSGGMSTVFRAHDPDRDIDVAIKLLQDETPGNATVLRFQREARAAGRLNHQNVARVLDFGSADGKLYLVMELVQGKSLADLIKQNGALSLNEALPVFEGTAAGLAHAHSNGVLHRDIKPSNIMLAEEDNGDPVVKIVDFGIARLIESDDRLTISGANIGSPLYMSPEQASAASVDERSDIYSLGCLMYECLAGAPPFRGGTAVETMMMHRNETPTPLSLESGETGAGLESLIMQCLAKDPHDRPANMNTLKGRLKELIDKPPGEDYTAESEPGEDLAPSKGTSRRLTGFILAGLCLVVLAVLAIPVYNGLTPSKTAPPPQRDVTISEFNATDIKPDKEDEVEISSDGTIGLLKEDATDKDIDRLKCPPLEHLKIKANKVTPLGLERIARLPLTHLTLEDTRFDASSLASLQGIPGLKGLCLIRNKNIDDNAMETISTFKPFESLELYDCPVTDRGMRTICEKLDLSGLILRDLRMVSAAGLENLKSLKKLVYLSVQIEHLEPEQAVKGIASSKAPDICLIHLPVGKKELRFFSDNQVRSLLVDRARKDAAEAIGKWKALMNLTINADEFDHDDIKSIAAIKKLNLLKLKHKPLESADLDALAGSSVAGLVLESCSLDSNVLMHLLESPHLVQINIEKCKGITETQLEVFKKAYEKRWRKPLECRFEAPKGDWEDYIDLR